MTTLNRSTVLPYVLVAAALILAAAVFIITFQNLPTEGTRLGIDNIFYALDNWDIQYSPTGRDGLKNPPWSVLPLIPIGTLLELKAAWGLLVFLTIGITILSVPQFRPRWRYWLAVALTVISYPSLRNIADANLEGILIAGVLLVLAGFNRKSPWLLALGVLVATVKPQSVSLLLVVLAVYVLQTGTVRSWLTCGVITAAVVIPAMLWRGEAWLNSIRNQYQAGTIIDIGLTAALNRTGVVPPLLVTLAILAVLVITLAVAWFSRRELSHEKMGLLLAGSMLIAPYVAGNSMLAIIAFGMIPLFIAVPPVGIVLLLLVNFPFLWSRELVYDYSSYWWTLLLLTTWGILIWRIYQREIKTQA